VARRIWPLPPSPLLLGAIWVILVLVGMDHLLTTLRRAGDPARRHGMAHDELYRACAGKAQLILVRHPRCPCTRPASKNLSQLMAHCQGSVQAHFYFRSDGPPIVGRSPISGGARRSHSGVEVVLDRAAAGESFSQLKLPRKTLLYGLTASLVFSRASQRLEDMQTTTRQ